MNLSNTQQRQNVRCIGGKQHSQQQLEHDRNQRQNMVEENSSSLSAFNNENHSKINNCNSPNQNDIITTTFNNTDNDYHQRSKLLSMSTTCKIQNSIMNEKNQHKNDYYLGEKLLNFIKNNENKIKKLNKLNSNNYRRTYGGVLIYFFIIFLCGYQLNCVNCLNDDQLHQHQQQKQQQLQKQQQKEDQFNNKNNNNNITTTTTFILEEIISNISMKQNNYTKSDYDNYVSVSDNIKLNSGITNSSNVINDGNFQQQQQHQQQKQNNDDDNDEQHQHQNNSNLKLNNQNIINKNTPSILLYTNFSNELNKNSSYNNENINEIRVASVNDDNDNDDDDDINVLLKFQNNIMNNENNNSSGIVNENVFSNDDFSNSAFGYLINDNNNNNLESDINQKNSNSNLYQNDDLYYESFGIDKSNHKSNNKFPIYLNEFAVHIPAGQYIADRIADKYGFTNLGQIGSLKDYYLFNHRHISKRSLRTSDPHHDALKSEPEVRWMQQQHEKIRKKRDYVRPDIRFPSLNFGRNSHASTDTTGFGGTSSLVRSISPQTRLQYRDAGSHNIFPDPLFKEQWYLNGGAKDGLDMNVGPAWQKGYTGKGVVVSILDDGIQTNHPDLAQNYDPDASYDINGNDSDPMPQDNGDNKHGTRCAGEVAAVAFNNYCGVGVAYNSSIGGVRMLDGSVNDAVEAKALSLNPQHIDIYSASWGPEDDGSTVDGPGPLARRAFIYGVTSGRQGKGSIFVWASGNGGRYTDSCNCDGYTNSIFTLSISSATQGGFKPWYLEECSSTLATTYSSGTPGHDKSVATVDMDGRLRPDHICTVEHTGTSASAPLAAGICALALEANPSLTWRDMQYLVVMTSRPEPLEKEMGWILNGVKRKYSHKFGYGLMDAGAMVSLAEQWTTVPPQHICKSRENNEDRQIEGTYGYTLQTHMDVNGCAGTLNEVRYLEHVQCKITLRFFPRGNLRILLTSPMGTTSTLLFERPRDIVKSNFDDWPFLSVHFWGEKAEGRWTLQVINGGRRRVNQPGILSKWQLIFYGTQINPIRLKGDVQDSSNLRRITGLNPFVFPTDSDLGQPTGSFYNNDPYSGYLNYQNLFTGAGSNPEKAVATIDGHNIPTPQRQNVMADSNNKLVLHDCDPECDSQGCYGRGPTQCVACKHYRLDNTCVSRCPPRSFPNQGGVCWPCHESCETCAGAGQDSCLTCAPAHLHVTDLAVCLQVCPEGYYENYDNKTCVPCEANCASCQDRPDYCTSCDHHLVMHEHKCYSACPLHTYETEDYNCASCHPTCATCNGSSESQCITCRSGRFAFDGKCLNSCPDGYYGDKKRQECVACPTGCATCSSNGFCLTCKENWTKNKKGKCIANGSDNCDESEYYDNGHCHSCHSTCETCDGPTETNCLTCPPSLLLQGNRCVSTCDDGYYMEAGVCAKCLHTCTQCVSRMNCTACAKGLQLQSGECRTTCADGYYSDRGTCAKCYLSCHTCSGPRRDQCVQCPKGWQLAGGECHPECPEGFYKSEFGCQKCHHYCKTCNGAGPLACTSCPPHFMLDGGLCMECLGSQYYDSPTQTCKTCHESCRSCSGPGQYSCQTCAFPLNLDRLNNQCVPCCPTDASPDDQSCCHCDKDTGGCINASPAGKRRIAVGAEQQFGNSENGYGNLGGLNGGDDETTGGVLSHVGSPLTTITAIAVAGCLLIVTIFAVIFAILQRNSGGNGRTTKGSIRNTHTGVRYNKLPTKSRKSLASSSTTLQINLNEPDDDDFEDDDYDYDYADEGEDDVVYKSDDEEANTSTINEDDALVVHDDDDYNERIDNSNSSNKVKNINISGTTRYKVQNEEHNSRKNYRGSHHHQQQQQQNQNDSSKNTNTSPSAALVRDYTDGNGSSFNGGSDGNLLSTKTSVITIPSSIRTKINNHSTTSSSDSSRVDIISPVKTTTTTTTTATTKSGSEIEPIIICGSGIKLAVAGSSCSSTKSKRINKNTHNRFTRGFISSGTQYDEDEVMIIDELHSKRRRNGVDNDDNGGVNNVDNDDDNDDITTTTFHPRT